jgi:hypothetical protein
MTRDDVICMAQKAGLPTLIALQAAPALERFAELVAKAEREACAKMCDNYDIRAKTSDGWIILTEAQRVSSELATKIRARNNNE